MSSIIIPTTQSHPGHRRPPSAKLARILLTLVASAFLSACDGIVLLNPAGDVARQQSDLLIAATGLMLLIVVPVIVLTLWFAWRYREGNEEASYKPDWDHSTQLELYIWSGPLLIIIALGAMTWVSTHILDPFRPLSRLSEDKPIAAEAKPLEIKAIALEWKWLFIYPEQGIATVNEIAAPIDTPISFKITSSEMMNSLFIPSLAGMVYAMPGMETQIQAVMNEPGDYYGVSGNYSGEGYSHMNFRFKGMSDADFQSWVAAAQTSKQSLSKDTYVELREHSIDHPVTFYSGVDAGLYHRILNRCVDAGKTCMHEMMSHSGEH